MSNSVSSSSLFVSSFLLSVTCTVQQLTTTTKTVKLITTKATSFTKLSTQLATSSSRTELRSEVRSELLQKFDFFAVECITKELIENKIEEDFHFEKYVELFNATCTLQITIEKFKAVEKLEDFYEKLFTRLLRVFPNQVECIILELFEMKLTEKYALMGWQTMSIGAIMKAAKLYIEVCRINCETREVTTNKGKTTSFSMKLKKTTKMLKKYF